MTEGDLETEKKSATADAAGFGRFSLGQRFLVWLVATLVFPFALFYLRLAANTFVLLCMAGSVAVWFALRIGKKMTVAMSWVVGLSAAFSVYFLLAICFGMHVSPD